jgi:hypothetical protein
MAEAGAQWVVVTGGLRLSFALLARREPRTAKIYPARLRGGSGKKRNRLADQPGRDARAEIGPGVSDPARSQRKSNYLGAAICGVCSPIFAE